jgi:hypothetical protein
MLIQSSTLGSENKEDQSLDSAKSGKGLQDPHHPRNKNSLKDAKWGGD